MQYDAGPEVTPVPRRRHRDSGVVHRLGWRTRLLGGWLRRRWVAGAESALDQAARLHRISEADSREILMNLPAEFNAELYRWEQDYFFKNCLGRYFRIDSAKLRKLAALPELKSIAQRLARLPRVLVHRDFQSQNIIVRNGQAYLIDFQGMRPGLPEYDVASLLYDPYVELSGAERSELTTYYIERQKELGLDLSRFSEILPLCGIQRLMQALGAYGYLGLVKKHEAFLHYIPSALKSLLILLATQKGLEPVAELVASAASR